MVLHLRRRRRDSHPVVRILVRAVSLGESSEVGSGSISLNSVRQFVTDTVSGSVDAPGPRVCPRYQAGTENCPFEGAWDSAPGPGSEVLHSCEVRRARRGDLQPRRSRYLRQLGQSRPKRGRVLHGGRRLGRLEDGSSSSFVSRSSNRLRCARDFRLTHRLRSDLRPYACFGWPHVHHGRPFGQPQYHGAQCRKREQHGSI